MEDKDIVASCIGVIALRVLISIVGLALQAWAIGRHWEWFIQPAFGAIVGLPASLSAKTALGMSLLFSILQGNVSRSYDDNWVYSFSVAIIALLFSVLVGWLIVLFA